MAAMCAAAVASMLALSPAVGQAAGGKVPHTYQSTLTPAQIAALAANPDQQVIILFRNQHPEAVARSLRSIRAARLAADQAQILSELRSLRAPKVHGYSVLNAVSAKISSAEATRLAGNPAVLAVVPDTEVAGPSPAASLAAAASVTGGRPLANPRPTGPAQQICPSDPAQPLLEPEALGLLHVPAAHSIVNGAGVKIAVFPDGLDPNIPDFMRGGTSAIFDYQDFSGEGTFAVTGGGEAFGDASSLISQGNQVFDLSGEVNPAHPLPPGCNIRIVGVAPGASVAVMKVFGDQNFAFNSLIIQGIEYALTVDDVDILSESFGGNPVPNAGTDPIAMLDSLAVAAGVTVVASTGDAGTTNTIGTPSDADGVIAAGATTSYQLYAQTSSYGYQLGAGGWVSNNVSAFSSSGDTEYGPHTIDIVAPGESGWADCSTNTAIFTECSDIYNGASPQPIEAFGGTSESCPLTAGVAALVIEAYRNTHGGATPSPQLVKRIITSTATDLHIPAQNQGAGLVNALAAVQAAMSVHDSNGTPAPKGSNLLVTPNELSFAAEPGQTSVQKIAVTNISAAPQFVAPSVRQLGAAVTLTAGSLTLNPTTDPTFIYQTGATAHDVHEVNFTVPAGVDRLVSRIAWSGDELAPGGNTIRASLFDASGRMVSQSRPQGPGGGFGEDEIHNPMPGTWTLVVFDSTGSPYSGTLNYSVTAAHFQTVAGAVTPAAQVIAPGATAAFAITVKTPTAPADRAEAVVFATKGASVGTVAIVTRALIPIGKTGGSFAGEITGGNARMPFYGQELVYQFRVPAGAPALNVDVTVLAPGYQLYGFLADPNGLPVDIQGTSLQDGSGTNLQTLHLTWARPAAGLWNLDLTQINGISSLLTSVPVSGSINFKAASVSSTGIPNSPSVHLAAGVPVTATIHVTNTGNSPAEFSLDPRLNAFEALSLASLNPTSGTLPISVSNPNIPQFIVPPFSNSLAVAAQSTVPVNFDTSSAFGVPDILSSTGKTAVASIHASDIPASIWSCTPTEIGPGLSVSAPFSCSAAAMTRAFDPAVDSSTGNVWSALEGLTPNYSPLVLMPGQSGDITVTFTPSGTSGTHLSGFIAVESFSFVTVSSDQLVRIPYSYTIS